MGRVKEKEPETVDTGTPELQQHHKVRPIPVRGDGFEVHLKVTDQREIDRLLMRDVIDLPQHSALEDFSDMLRKCHMMGPAIGRYDVRYTQRRSPDSVTSNITANLVRVGEITEKIDAEAGLRARTFLIDTLVYDIRVSKQNQPMFLKAVEALLRHL